MHKSTSSFVEYLFSLKYHPEYIGLVFPLNATRSLQNGRAGLEKAQTNGYVPSTWLASTLASAFSHLVRHQLPHGLYASWRHLPLKLRIFVILAWQAATPNATARIRALTPVMLRNRPPAQMMPSTGTRFIDSSTLDIEFHQNTRRATIKVA